MLCVVKCTSTSYELPDLVSSEDEANDENETSEDDDQPEHKYVALTNMYDVNEQAGNVLNHRPAKMSQPPICPCPVSSHRRLQV